MKKKIVHISPLHRRDDDRVFQKELISLSAHFDCYFIVADGLGNEIKNNINIIDVGKFKGTKDRLTRVKKLILKKALELNADLYQYHDAEVNLIGLKLLKKGKKVVYDAHEDTPRQYRANGKGFKSTLKIKLVSNTIEYIENKTAKRLHGIITATEGIQKRYLKFNANTITIKNYVVLKEMTNTTKWIDRENSIAYVGGISKKRGLTEILDVIYELQIPLKLAGVFLQKEYEQECKNHKGWQYVDFIGYVGWKEINSLLSKTKIGLLTLYPTPNHNLALPIKLFEYMAASIPVIVSNIPLWEKIVNKAKCGIIVNPKKPEEIVKAIRFIFNDDKNAEKMGLNGKEAAINEYNWKIESIKLIDFYNKIIKGD